MRPEELKSHLTIQPFTPFRIHLSDSRSLDVKHPDQVIVSKTAAWVGVGRDPEHGIIDDVEHCALLHIVGVEELRAA
jgi:hypothetical protein